MKSSFFSKPLVYLILAISLLGGFSVSKEVVAACWAALILLAIFVAWNIFQLNQFIYLLTEQFSQVASGDFFKTLKVSTKEKSIFARCARSFNEMLVSLNERDKQKEANQLSVLQNERLTAIGQLSSEIVHEIRNPLNSINLNIDWLQETIKDKDSEVQNTLSSISREIKRLYDITESYLVKAKIPTQSVPRVNANELISEILDFEKQGDRQKKISVEVSLSSEPIFIRSDKAKLKQAFINVIKNAKEAMPRGGSLKVRSEIQHNVSKIYFSDTGYGMNDFTKVNSFRPFYTTKTNGTGIGLAITKNIVEEAQGELSFESHVGKGTTFIFQFPV